MIVQMPTPISIWIHSNQRISHYIPIQIPIPAAKPQRIPAHPPSLINPQDPSPNVKPLRLVPPVPDLAAETQRIDRGSGNLQLRPERLVQIIIGNITI